MSLVNWGHRLYQRLFFRRAFYGIHKRMFLLSLGGLGILNYAHDRSASEDHVLSRLTNGEPHWTIFDVGAHDGGYSRKLRACFPNAAVHAFEPHPTAFARLQAGASECGYIAHNLACSDAAGSLTLYDYPAEKGGSEHASLYPEVLSEIHAADAVTWNVRAVTLDAFVKENAIARIDFLKIDTEGNELKVLRGAQKTISRGAIPIIQFEFNEMNVVSRVFFRDFYRLLPDYAFYRMLPDGLIALGDYQPLICEIYSCQNVIAIHNSHLGAVAEVLDIGNRAGS